jgi:DNA repair protein RadC
VPRERGLRSLTAALRRGPPASGNPAHETVETAVMTTLYVRDASGFRAAEPTDILDRAQALLAQRYRTGSPVLTSPALTRDFLRMHVGASECEIFGILHLDSRHRLIAVENLFRGTINSASVHPREVVKAALVHNAAAVVLFHNHPSGLSEPSAADELITRRLKEALALIDVRVLDHLIVAESIYSFAEHGLL